MDINNKAKDKKLYFVSPLEVRHYILDIPVTKPKYQYNAVKFALRPLYPGNETSTVIDYISRKKNILGIAANSKRIENLKEEYNSILSPVLVVCQIIKNGIVISAGKDWLELQIIKDGFPVFLQSYSYRMYSKCLEDEERLSTEYNFTDKNKSVFLFDVSASDLPCNFTEKGFDVRYIENYQKAYKIDSACLYIERKQKNNTVYLFALIPLLILLILLDVSYYKKSKTLKNDAIEIRKNYQAAKLNITTSNTNNEFFESSINNVYSITDILNEIYKTSTSIRIISLTLNDNNLKFEAENATAIKVLDKLSESALLRDVVLHQSLPQDNGFERFVISGKIKND